MKIEWNKKTVILLVVIMLLIISSGTLAYFFWEVEEEQKTVVSLSVEGGFLTIEGGNVYKEGMYPTADCDGEAALIGDVATVTAVIGGSSDMDAIIRIRATLTVNQGVLSAEDKEKINWALVDTSAGTTCETTPYKGTMASVTTNTDIDTGIKFVALSDATTVRTYQIYVWLDSSYVYYNEGSDVTDPMQNLGISVKFSPASELQHKVYPNAPVLDDGMIPVTIANDGTVTTISESDSTWYDYGNKEWANVVLVNEASRSNYLGTTGKTITQSDILAYYVWIPRYKYRIPSSCSDLDSPTIEEYPECYAPYTISDGDKNLLINFLYEYYGSDEEFYPLEAVTEDVENLVNIGKTYMEEDAAFMLLEDIIFLYNEEGETPIMYTGEFNASNTVMEPKTIDIVFEPKDASKSIGDAVNTYYTHPAFTFGDEELSGIWVGKFDTSVGTLSACYTSTTYDSVIANCNNGNQEPRILPNVKPLTRQNIANKFITSLKFSGGTLSDGIVTFSSEDIYGLTSTTDSHMMKNSEWGAVAYLSHSQYGLNAEVSHNGGNITGCGTTEGVDECQIAYGSGVSSYPQSTSGNITGIFDMSGGFSEAVMAVLSDSNGKPMSGYNSDSNGNSGFNGLLHDGLIFSSGINFPESKYYDLYVDDSYYASCNGKPCYGHALHETVFWYGDNAYFVGLYAPWFNRGGFGSSEWNGLFNTNNSSGGANQDDSWRSVLVVD